jgi:hypothetical protein
MSNRREITTYRQEPVLLAVFSYFLVCDRCRLRCFLWTCESTVVLLCWNDRVQFRHCSSSKEDGASSSETVADRRNGPYDFRASRASTMIVSLSKYYAFIVRRRESRSRRFRLPNFRSVRLRKAVRQCKPYNCNLTKCYNNKVMNNDMRIDTVQ